MLASDVFCLHSSDQLTNICIGNVKLRWRRRKSECILSQSVRLYRCGGIVRSWFGNILHASADRGGQPGEPPGGADLA